MTKVAVAIIHGIGDTAADFVAAVKQDVALNAGGIFTSWNPRSHPEYWTDNEVTPPVADTLTKLWRAANP